MSPVRRDWLSSPQATFERQVSAMSRTDPGTLYWVAHMSHYAPHGNLLQSPFEEVTSQ
jgi:hypothetical protein